MKKYESLKKVELHCHLDGSLNPEKVSRWTRKNINEIEGSLKLKKCGKDGISECTSYQNSLLQTKTRLKDAAEQLCKDLMKDSVIYAEIRLDPLAHTKKGLEPKEVIDAVLEGLNLTNLKAKLILLMKRDRSLDENKSIIDLAKKYSKKGVVAVDLAGNETEYPTSSFKELFTYAKSSNIPFTIHTGETTDAKGIDSAISFGATRIGHGIKAISSFDTMEKLKKNDIPLEICLSSNMYTCNFLKYSDHPVQRLVDSGVKIVICSDNLTLCDTTLTDEYNLLNKVFGFTIKEFNEINKYAIEHSFLSQKEKDEFIHEFD